MTALASVLREREYTKYAAASVLAALGSGMQFVAISWLLYQLTQSASASGWNFIIATLPGLLLSPWIGVWVDRWAPRRICIGADAFRGLVILALALGLHAGLPSVLLIYGATFLIALADNFFQPAVAALVRDIVPREKLLSANIVGNMSMQIGTLCGASLGGLLVAQFGAEWIVTVTALMFFASALFTVWIRSSGGPAEIRSAAPRTAFADEFLATMAHIRANHQIVWLATLQMFVYVVLYVCNTLLPAFVAKELGEGAWAFGSIDAAWGVGAILGGLTLSSLVRKLDRRALGLGGLLLLALALLTFLTSQGVAQACAAYLMLGFICCLIRVNTDTILVAEIPSQLFGKVKATVAMFIAYMGLAIYACIGYLGDKVPLRSIYLAIVIALLLALVLAWLPGVGLRAASMGSGEPEGGLH